MGVMPEKTELALCQALKTYADNSRLLVMQMRPRNMQVLSLFVLLLRFAASFGIYETRRGLDE